MVGTTESIVDKILGCKHKKGKHYREEEEDDEDED